VFDLFQSKLGKEKGHAEIIVFTVLAG